MILSSAPLRDLIAVADQKPKHATDHRCDRQRLPRVIVNVFVGHIADIFRSLADAALDIANSARHFRFLVGFVCSFHIPLHFRLGFILQGHCFRGHKHYPPSRRRKTQQKNTWKRGQPCRPTLDEITSFRRARLPALLFRGLFGVT